MCVGVVNMCANRVVCEFYMVCTAGGAVDSCVGLFFFQAEDGIRDLVRSRGLGDVYKRQAHGIAHEPGPRYERTFQVDLRCDQNTSGSRLPQSVSYTHLTLPTSDLV